MNEVCTQHAAVFLRLLALLPKLHVTTSREALGPDTFLLTVTVENQRGISTIGTDVARNLPHVELLIVELVDTTRAKDGPRRRLGHLGGPQLGRFGSGTTWPYQNTEGEPVRRRCQFVVVGATAVALRVGSPRTGYVDVVG